MRSDRLPREELPKWNTNALSFDFFLFVSCHSCVSWFALLATRPGVSGSEIWPRNHETHETHENEVTTVAIVYPEESYRSGIRDRGDGSVHCFLTSPLCALRDLCGGKVIRVDRRIGDVWDRCRVLHVLIARLEAAVHGVPAQSNSRLMDKRSLALA